MKNLILASTSTLFGQSYLEYLHQPLQELFNGVSELIFIPYARPGGISHNNYTQKARQFFAQLNINVVGIHSFENKAEAIENAQAFFTGGGNTFLLVKQLKEKGLINSIQQKVENGTPYLGTSAGTNIAGQTMKTTNDMPIVFPSDFDCMKLVSFNINPHYLDPGTNSTHKGETREMRIKEYLEFNTIPVVGLREGNWLEVKGETVINKGVHTARIFEKGKEPYELAVDKIMPI